MMINKLKYRLFFRTIKKLNTTKSRDIILYVLPYNYFKYIYKAKQAQSNIY